MSIRFEVVRSVQVTKHEAYSALLDLDSANDWMQDLVKIEKLDEGSGPLKVGRKQEKWMERKLLNLLKWLN